LSTEVLVSDICPVKCNFGKLSYSH
jgi:hypothetical protein